LTFADPKDYDKIETNDRLSIVDLAHLAPSKPVTVVIHKASGDVKIQAHHSMTAQ
jgi:aconitate hydratase A / 2-methylisocitrate dehydratase